jgi:two-component system chemotaxis response regulator CheY
MPSPQLLIADDDATVHELIAQIAIYVRPEVVMITAFNGAEALTAFRTHGADLVVTDLQMPLMNGLALVEALRALPSAVPIVMLSSEREAEAAALAAGVTRFLAKPLAAEVVWHLLGELLPGSRRVQ